MLRIKQTHGTDPATYHFWNGVTPIKENPSGWGTLVAPAIPIIEVDETGFALLENTAIAFFEADVADGLGCGT